MTHFAKITLLASVFFVAHTPLSLIDTAQAETSNTESVVEGGTCTPKDEKGAALMDKDGTPMMGKYQRKIQTAAPSQDQTAAPLPEKLSIAAPEAVLASEDILIFDTDLDESMNKIVKFTDLKAIPSDDQKTFHMEGNVTMLGSNPQKLELNLLIQHFSDEEFKNPISESKLTAGRLAGGESIVFKSEPQQLSPKGRFVRVTINE